jgi:hypothetical protein
MSAKTKLAGDTATAKVVIEVPRAALPDVMTLAWDAVQAQAARAGWRVQRTEAFDWCKADHALVREGSDEMRGIPVLYYQRW